MKIQLKTILAILFAVCAINACGGSSDNGGTSGGSGDTAYAKALGGGVAKDIADFNGKSIYTIISYQPAAILEANAAPSTTFPWTIVTANGVAPSIIGPVNKNSATPSKNQIYGKGQTDCDLKMREFENTILASKAPQFSKKIKGIDAAAPATIALDTPWTSVKIFLTGNTIDTTCKKISSHAYIFVDDRDIASSNVTDAKLTAYGNAFDTIYDIDHTHFGTENDTDSNGKVIIVFTQEITGGVLGYFFSADKYSYDVTYNPNSNEGDIFYMTADTYTEATICGTLAHEFQHMIYFDEHYDRSVTSTFAWLNEALSQAAEFYNGYNENHDAWIGSFLSGYWSGLSLTYWTSDNYGYGAIFIRYLIDQYGDTAIKNMCSTNLVGIAAVVGATGENFNTIFNNFTRAIVISGTGDTTDTKYNFKTLNLQALQTSGRQGLIPSGTTFSSGASDSSSNVPYEIVFKEGVGTFSTITLSGTDYVGTAFGLSQ